MAWRALQNTVRGLFSRRRQQSPSSSPSGQPRATTTGASELNEKVQGRLHRAAARGDLAWLRRWRWYYKRVGIDPPDQQRRTPLHLASAKGHADVVKYLTGKNCKLNVADDLKRTPLMTAVQCQQEKCVAILLERGADPNLADADSNTALHLAVLSGNTTVAGLLLEHNASSDAENQEGYTPLNLAVSKHEGMLKCLLRKAADGHAAEQCERTALAITTSHEADVEEDKLHLQEELEKVKVELQEVEEKYLNSERCVQNLMAALEEKEREATASAQELQDMVLEYLETVKQLEEHMELLGFQNTCLIATVQQQSKRIEALKRDLQATTSAQAASQDRLEHIRIRHPASLSNQLKDQIRDLECKLDKLRNTQQDSTFPKECAQAEVEKYKELYPKEVKISKRQAKELESFSGPGLPSLGGATRSRIAQRVCAAAPPNYLLAEKRLRDPQLKFQRANERLEKSNAKLLWKRLKSKWSTTSSSVSRDLAATPVLHSTALGHLGNRSGLDSSQIAGDRFLREREKYRSSRKKLVASVAKVQQKQEEKFSNKLEKATAELETGFAQCSKKFYLL